MTAATPTANADSITLTAAMAEAAHGLWLTVNARVAAANLGGAAEANVAPSALLLCRDRFAFTVSLLACWRAGVRAILPPSGLPAIVAQVQSDARICMVLHDGDAAGVSEDLALDVRRWSDKQPMSTAGTEVAAKTTLWPWPLDDAALLAVYTSGSTSAYRPCEKSVGQLRREVMALAAAIGIGRSDRLAVTVPPQHLYGLLFGVLLPLATGATVSRETPLHAPTVARVVRELSATVLVTVPAHLHAIQPLAPGQLVGLRTMISSTAPLAEPLAMELTARHSVTVIAVLGATETGGIALRRPVDQGTWTPLPQVEVDVGLDGQLFVTSPWLPAGGPRPWPTDDRVALRDDGTFVHVGRRDDVVKIGGKRIALSLVRAAILDIAGVDDAAVIAEAVAGSRGARIGAVVASKTLDVETLRRSLRGRLDDAAMPRRLRIVPSLPRNATGKLPRAALLSLLGSPQLVPDNEALESENRSIPLRALTLTVPAGFHRFDGHFPEASVLPGVSVLHDVVVAPLLRHRPGLGHPVEVRRLKFRQVVRPLDTVAVGYKALDGGWVSFTVHCGEALCASGHLRFAGAA